MNTQESGSFSGLPPRRYHSINSLSPGGRFNTKDNSNTKANSKPRPRNKYFLAQITDKVASRKLIPIKKHAANWNQFLRNIVKNTHHQSDKIFLTLLLALICSVSLYLWHGYSRALELGYLLAGFLIGTAFTPLIQQLEQKEALANG